MSEQNRSSYSNRERSPFIFGRIIRYCLSAIDRKRKFRIPRHLHSNDWNTWTYELDFSVSWVGYRIVIAAASIAAFGFGLVQLYLKLNGRS